MADGVFNISKGKIVQQAEDAAGGVANAALTLVLLSAAEADDTLNNYDDLAALIAAGGNTEADFTNYARKEVSGGDVTVTVDDGNNRVDIDITDQTWTSAGNGTNNSLVKLLVCYDADTTAGTDGDIVPMGHFDLSVTTDGSDLTIQIDSAGLLRAA